MPLTRYPHGVSSFGVPVIPSGKVFGKHWFVDAKLGSDGNIGTDPANPLLTMSAAFDKISSGDVIYFIGKLREQLSAPEGVFDVTIIGASNRPRHADDHSESSTTRGSSGSTWAIPTSPAAATPLLTVRQQGWRLANFLMQADTSQVCVDLFRDGGSGDDERDATHFSCYDMRFEGAGIGIRDNGGCNFVGIYDSLFRGMTTGIAQTTGAGIGTLSWWEIVGNRFESNTNHAVAPLSRGLVKQNAFMTFTTKGLDISGGTAGLNVVTENTMMGDYDAGFVGGTGDFWFNNYSDDTTSAEVDDTTGQTTAAPAA